ncbi:MAG: hypothetical protein B6I20_14570 [Bacteroidetes bacterium 4572_117]|nr:MAG: hypothetical protein B6I20_14570 [Bacteroidetes bacterium 4572_117]
MVNKNKKHLPLLERYGLWYMKRLRKKQPLKRIDLKAYILDDEERTRINKIEKKAITNVAIAGILSSLVSGMAGYFADPLVNDSASFLSEDNLLYWSIVIGVTIIASLIEILYIYYDIMAKTHALTKAAHLNLFDNENDMDDIAASIVRAALELPNKIDSDIKINPTKESSKVVIIMATILYKLKISVSNFLLKALVKRMMGRAVSRAWLNFLAIPVCAFWNAIVCWFVIREVKIRVLGPSAANEILNKLDKTNIKLSENGKIALLRAVGSCIVRTADLHPNLEYLYRSIDVKVNEPSSAILDDSAIFLTELSKLNKEEQGLVLYILVYAAIIDGKITYREKKLLEEAYEICNKPFNYVQIKKLIHDRF